MNDQLDLFSSVQPEPAEEYKDPKTGKTISRKRAYIIAGAAMVAGSAMNEIMGTPGIEDVTFDSDGDGIGDTVLTDANEDGIYEIPADPADETGSADNQGQQQWNPNTAPMAAPGTVSDQMSFSEAFSAAREELGAGGVFAWQGQYYNTFYAEELNDNDQPVVEYEVTDHHDLGALEEYDSEPVAAQEPSAQDTPEAETGSAPAMMAADFNMDGVIDAVYIDLNEDGSADAVYTDLNQDGQIAEDEVVLIHDPENLARPDTPADSSMMSVDTNADGIDDILIADVDGDQVGDAVGIDQNSDYLIDESEIIILNPEAMENTELAPETVEYSGEIAADMPEDVSEDVLDGMTDDVANLEDNFDEINNWS
jgi:hypothetical protein